MKRRLLFFKLILVGAIVFSPLFMLHPAKALDPLSAWTNDLTGFGSNQTETGIFTHPNGDVTVGRCDQNNATIALKSFASSGTVLGERTVNEQPTPLACTIDTPGMKTTNTDAVGNIYSSYRPSSNVAQKLASYEKDGDLRWDKDLPIVCYQGEQSTIFSLNIGSNGNLYGLIAGGSWCNEYRLVGFNASDGTLLSGFPVALNAQDMSSESSVVPYQNGLVLRMKHKVAYFSYTGQPGNTYTVDGMASYYSRPDRGHVMVTADGRVFTPDIQEGSSTSECPVSRKAIGVKAYDPNGTGWSGSLSGCLSIRSLYALPSGGVVAQAFDFASPKESKLFGFDVNGNMTWQKDLPQVVGSRNYINEERPMFLHTDSRGHLIMQTPYLEDNYRHVEIEIIDGANGDRLSSFSTAEINPHDSFFVFGHNGIVNNRLYLALTSCSGQQSWCNQNPKLYAFNVPGIGMEYPRSSILNTTTPSEPQKIKYVALGDSYSSGEGVPPFSPSTSADNNVDVDDNGVMTKGIDTARNVCHRSDLAYPRLINDDPRVNVDLVDFRACSGAKSDQIVGEWPDNVDDAKDRNWDEPAQLSVINDADIVTLTIGGNDVGFGDLASWCTVAECYVKADDVLDEILNTLPGKLNTMLNAVKNEISSQTDVYVVGYPQLFPGSIAEAPPATPHPACGLHVEISNNDAWFARQIVAALNATIENAVNAQNDLRFKYVDPTSQSSPFSGHELCTADSFFHYAQLADYEYSYHPTAKGQKAYADTLLEWLSD